MSWFVITLLGLVGLALYVAIDIQFRCFHCGRRVGPKLLFPKCPECTHDRRENPDARHDHDPAA